MEMHQIRYFLAAARTLNFTRAAEECNVAQPSLTRAIQQLEEELGGDLFRRERKLSHLTDLGQRMQPLMQQCFDMAQSAKSLANSIKRGEIASLRLALSHTVDISLLVPFLSELNRAFNGLELKFLRGNGIEIAEKLKQGDAELGIAGPWTNHGQDSTSGRCSPRAFPWWLAPSIDLPAGPPLTSMNSPRSACCCAPIASRPSKWQRCCAAAT
jgi:DNA-binding transcriptional LysR family regulator